MDVKPPKQTTLNRYGLTQGEWLAILARQGGRCPICKRGPDQVTKWATDHEHVAGFKKLPPQERSRFVRGVCCLRCNMRFIGEGLNAALARNVAAYLEAYEARGVDLRLAS